MKKTVFFCLLTIRAKHRYVLLGCGAGEIFIYDVHGLGYEQGKLPVAAATRDGGAGLHHSKGVCLADWYYNDNGVFHVGSFDGSVGVWDTNAMQCAHLYQVSDCCNVIAPGIFPDTSPLIAVGTKSDQLRLLDVRQEANTHTLVGHREQVTSLLWSNTKPHTLFSGDLEGTIYVWDLRKPIPVAEVGSAKPPQIIGALGRSESTGVSYMSSLGEYSFCVLIRF